MTHADLEKIEMTLPSGSNVIFIDIGTENLETLEFWDVNQVYILDHHSRPKERELAKNVQLFNPLIFTNDMTVQISSSALSYYIGTSISSKNTYLSIFVIIGTLGERSTLNGAFRNIIKEAKRFKLISNDKAVWFPDRSLSITSVLQNAELPRLNTREQVEEFLKRLDIPILAKEKSRSFYDLSESENRRLISELTTNYGINPKNLIKHDYQIINEPVASLRDARTFAAKLNIFGWLQRPDIGLALCLGDREEALRDAISVEEEFNGIMQKELDWVTFEEKSQKFKAIYFFDGRNSGITVPILAPLINTLGKRRELLPRPVLGCVRTKLGEIMIRVTNSHSLGTNFDCQNLINTMKGFMGPKARLSRSSIGTYGLIVPEGELSSLVKRTDNYLAENTKM
ncbi:MAG: hypothetical protein ACFFFG_12610 [Candidatus Thorarchaeota archaeon]